MKNKGFTLIELLATIAILMIILLIAVPRILDIMETARREAFRDTAYLITHTGKLFSAENPGDHEFYYIDSDEYNADGYFLDYSGTKPVTGIVLLNNNGKIAIALHNGTYCATKGGNETLVTITTNTPINCTVENIINTDKTWTEIATNWDIELDDLLDINDESNPNSPTEGLDIIIPVNVTGSTSSGTGDPETDSFTKTYYSMGYVTDEVSFPYSFDYTIELGVLPTDIADINSANVTAKSVFETLVDFKRYIVKRNMGEVIWPGADPVEIDINQASIFQAHANTSSNMTVDDVTVTCDAVTCEANIEVTVNNITGIDLYNINGNDIAYTPLKFTVEFNGVEDCPSNPNPDSCFTFASGTISDYDDGTCGTDVVIPCTIGGVDVTTIDEYAFEYRDLTSVIIPNTINSIGYCAFCSNLLTSIVIPDSVTSLGDYSFSYNEITATNLTSNITYLGEGAFENNSLSSIVIPSSITTIYDWTFEENQLTNISIPSSVTSIGEWAFATNQLTSIDIPNSVTAISQGAFDDNLLTSVDIPSSVTTIGHYAFMHNQITEYTITNSVTSLGYGILNDNLLPTDDAFIYARNGDGSIDNTILMSYGGSNRTNVVIPSNVITISIYGLGGNSITNVTIPNSVTSIEQYGFISNDLTSVDLPDNLLNLSGFTFNQITSIEIPDTVTNIGTYAFQDNYLTSVSIPSNVTTISTGAFSGNDLTTIAIPNNVTTINGDAFRYNALASASIGSGITYIGQYAFANNVLTNITMGKTATNIIANYMLTGLNNNFRTSYYAGGAGTYTGTQTGSWTKQ